MVAFNINVSDKIDMIAHWIVVDPEPENKKKVSSFLTFLSPIKSLIRSLKKYIKFFSLLIIWSP